MAKLHVRASIANLPAPTSEIEIDLPSVVLPENKTDEEVDKGAIKQVVSMHDKCGVYLWLFLSVYI